MKKYFKKYISIMIIVFSIITLFTGCGKVELSSDVTVNIDGSANVLVKVYYDDEIGKLIDNDLLSRVLVDNKEDINKYKSGEFNIEEVNITTDKIDIAKVKNIENEYLNINVNKDKGIFLDLYNIDIKLNKNMIEVIKDNIQTNINNNISNFTGLNLGQYISGPISTNITNYIKDIPYKLTISLPVSIVDSNATAKINNKSVSWSYNLGDLNENTELKLSFKAPNIINIIIIILIILVIIITGIIIKRNNKKN